MGISIGSDGAGLPPGRGTAIEGEAIYVAKCQACHGEKGIGPSVALAGALVGGMGTLAPDKTPIKTVGSYWPYATTLFDYVRRDTPVFAHRFGACGLATCFGASTVTLGSWVAEPVAVCDIAVPLGPHNNAVDRIATAEGAAKLDDNLMTSPPKSGTEMPSRHVHGTIHSELGHRGSKRYLPMT